MKHEHLTLKHSCFYSLFSDESLHSQPFDEDYLNHLDPPVKHMSFHAYLRKLTGGADK